MSPPESESDDPSSTDTQARSTGTEPPGQPTVDRRSVLAASGALLVGPAFPSTTPTLTVATRNLSLGVRLARLFDVRSAEALRRTAGTLLENVREHPYDARLDAIAAEVEATDPAVLAVQEAALVRERPGDGEDWATVVDVRDRLESSLAAAGLTYELAVSASTTDVELPAETDDGSRDVRFTDRVALLVRSDVEWSEPASGTFDAQFGLPFPGEGLAFERGFCTVDVTVGGVNCPVVSTHLESASASIRREQAEELLDRLPSDGRVALAGDFNSGPGTETASYDLLRESLTDAWATLRPDADGFTCCQAQQLTNDESLLHERVDAVFVGGGLHPTAVERVGHRPEDRVSGTRDGETVTVWPSDHAGVVATFEAVPPTPTPASSPTPSGRGTQSEHPTTTAGDAPMPGRNGSSTSASPTAVSGPSGGTGGGTRTETGDSVSNGLGPGFDVAGAVAGAALATLGFFRTGNSSDRPD